MKRIVFTCIRSTIERSTRSSENDGLNYPNNPTTEVATKEFFAWFPVPEGYVQFGLLDSEERLKEAAERIGNLGIF